MSGFSFHDYYETAMYIAIFGAVICAVIYFWPTPQWVKDDKRLSDSEESYEELITSQKQERPPILRAVLLLVIALVMASALMFMADMPPGFSIIICVAVIAMIAPTIQNYRARAQQKRGREEALAVAEYVAGRMSAQAPLFESLENLYKEFVDGKRELDITGEDLGELIRRVRLGNDLATELHYMALKFEHLHSLRQVWTTYQLMSQAGMGQEAEIYQANDLSESQTLSDELSSVLETEMSTATMSRVAMFLLIGGMIVFLVFFGDDLGDVLINTLPGNIVLAGSLFCLWLAQTVGSKLEELPILEF